MYKAFNSHFRYLIELTQKNHKTIFAKYLLIRNYSISIYHYIQHHLIFIYDYHALEIHLNERLVRFLREIHNLS